MAERGPVTIQAPVYCPPSGAAATRAPVPVPAHRTMTNKKRASMNGAVRVRGQDDACCGLFFLKYVLYIYNIIFWLSGLAVLAVGLWTLLDKHHYSSLLDSATYSTTTYLLLATGVTILLLGFLGCCGAWRDNRAALIIYAVCLGIIFLLEALSGILAYFYHATIHAELQQSLYDTMIHSYAQNARRTEAIDDLQTSFGCCGAALYTDWADCVWLRSMRTGSTEQELRTPDSCCKTVTPGCALRAHPSNVNTDGCVMTLEYYIKDHLIIIGAVGLGLCCLQIFGIVFACCLAKEIKAYKSRNEQSMWR